MELVNQKLLYNPICFSIKMNIVLSSVKIWGMLIPQYIDVHYKQMYKYGESNVDLNVHIKFKYNI